MRPFGENESCGVYMYNINGFVLARREEEENIGFEIYPTLVRNVDNLHARHIDILESVVQNMSVKSIHS